MGKVKREGASERTSEDARGKVSEGELHASEVQPTASEAQPSAPMVGNYKPIPRFNGHCPNC